MSSLVALVLDSQSQQSADYLNKLRFRNENMANFVDVSGVLHSPAWQYFLRSKETNQAKCTVSRCNAILKISGGNTTTLLDHLKNIHKIIPEQSQPSSKRQKTSQTTINFPKKEKKTLDERIARLCSESLISFNTIAKSGELREIYASAGYALPKSHFGVRACILREYELVKQKVIEDLAKLKEKGIRFSYTGDEWVSTGNKKYLNLNVHYKSNYYSLGLVRIVGSMPAEILKEMFVKHLQEFGIDYETDVVGGNTDGASLMVKFGKLIKPLIHLQCQAHGINLAVCDVIYSKKDEKVDIEAEDRDFDEEDIPELDGDEIGLAYQDVEDQEVLTNDYKPLVDKVRKYCKKFRKSAVKNDKYLQPLLKEELGKELNLILDCKTRWGSLHTMLERFIQVNKQLKSAMLCMECDYDITDAEVTKLKELCDALGPLKEASLALCRQDATVLESEIVFGVTIEALDELDTDISHKLKECFQTRILQRRDTELVHLISYLHDPSQRKGKDQFGFKIEREKIADLATKMARRMFTIKEEEKLEETEESNDKTLPTTNLTFKQKLEKRIEESKYTASKTKPLQTSFIKKEMDLFEASLSRGAPERPEHLELLYQSLLTLPPSSVTSERAFSAAGLFSTKIRSRLGDSTLNSLVFLRDFYKRQNKNV